MTQELHYTSVPRGLRPGSQGFCTVACTPRMSGPMIERLEALSGYQPVYPVHDPSASRNPINFSHLKLTIGAQTVNVLSRVGPARLDYSGRSNKYAHHVVLEASERPQAGPAWLLGRPGFMQETWEGEPRELPEGRRPPQDDRPPGIAGAWRAMIGDAGWAGVLAESFLADPKRPAILVFQPGMDLLPLFVEAIALLPPSRRWDVEFSTYFTTPPRGANCPWRGMIAGSPETENALRLPSALVINLLERRDAEGGALVHQARTGERPQSRDADTSESSPRAERRPAAASPNNLAAGPPPPGRPPGPTATKPQFPELSDRTAGRPPRLRDHGRPAAHHRPTWLLVAGILAACLIPLAALGFFLRGGDVAPDSDSGPVEGVPIAQVDTVSSTTPVPESAVREKSNRTNVSAGENRERKPVPSPSPGTARPGGADHAPALGKTPPGPGPGEPTTGSTPPGPESGEPTTDSTPPGPGPGEPTTGSKVVKIENPAPIEAKGATKPAEPAKVTVFLHRNKPPKNIPGAKPVKTVSRSDEPEFAEVKGFNLEGATIDLLGAAKRGLVHKAPNNAGGVRELVVSTIRPTGSFEETAGTRIATFRLSPDKSKVELLWEVDEKNAARDQLRDCVLVLTSEKPAAKRFIILRGQPKAYDQVLRMNSLANGVSRVYDLKWDTDTIGYEYDYYAGTNWPLKLEECRILDGKVPVFKLGKQRDGSWMDSDGVLTVKFEGTELHAIPKKTTTKKRSSRPSENDDPGGTTSATGDGAQPVDSPATLLLENSKDAIRSWTVHVVITWVVDDVPFEIARSPGIVADPLAKAPTP